MDQENITVSVPRNLFLLLVIGVLAIAGILTYQFVLIPAKQAATEKAAQVKAAAIRAAYQSKIVGTWHFRAINTGNDFNQARVKFTDDGRVVQTQPQTRSSARGTYEFLDANQMKFSFKFFYADGPYVKSWTTKVRFHGKELDIDNWKDLSGEGYRYHGIRSNPNRQKRAVVPEKPRRVSDMFREVLVYISPGKFRIRGASDLSLSFREVVGSDSKLNTEERYGPMLMTDQIKSTLVGTDTLGRPAVFIKFTASGQNKFKQITGELASGKKQLAILLNNKEVSALFVQGSFESAAIEGRFSKEEAAVVSSTLNARAKRQQ